MVTRCLGLALAVGAASILGACGGGGGIGGTAPIQVLIPATASLDGFATNAGSSGTSGGGPTTGDIDSILNGVGGRQFYSFDIGPIPLGANVTQAVLRLFQTSVAGTPYTTHGDVIADHVSYGATLDAAAFNAPALAANIGTLSDNTTLSAKFLDVTASVRSDRNMGRTRSQFRIRFSSQDTDSDGVTDHAQFADMELSTNGAVAGDEPVLIVHFEP